MPANVGDVRGGTMRERFERLTGKQQEWYMRFID
jgi:hypothetical protein